jgi:outer membrane protein OmpA-like peptidoglycan-associated protein
MFKAGKFYTSQKTSSGWSAPEAMIAPFNTFNWQADMSISADGKSILFAASGGAFGNQDIYVCLKQDDGSWAKPLALGNIINTSRSDRSPFLHPDGKTLYFSSEGHEGFGGSDIFMSKRLDDTWTNWSLPLNLGPAFNTSGNDWGFRVSTDGTFAYYSANLNGNADIVRCLLPTDIKPDKVATISGKVTDTKDVPLDAEILWEDLSTGKVVQITRSDPATGDFFAVLPERKRYGYTARKPGYFPQSGNVDMRTELTEVRLPRPIRLATIENMKTEDISLPLNNLFFETAKYELQPESFPELNRLAELIQSESLRIEVQGHTDNVGNDAGNQTLSENRAKSVRAYLIGRGCNAGNITAKGFGESKPKASNDTDEGRAQNRRVEIRVVR